MDKSKVRAEIIDARGMERTLNRLAFEILEQNGGAEKLVLIGLRTRGVPLAKRLAESIKNLEGFDVPIGSLDVTLYRDDVTRKVDALELQTTHIDFDIDGKICVLVDDVLYTGRTVRAALDAVTDIGRPERIELAVMVDRGHRQLPIKADFIGKYLPTSLGEEVSVKLKHIDGVDGVYLLAANHEAE